MTAAVQTSSEMPTLLSRKSRGYQTAMEKLEHVNNLSRQIRHRADFLNKQAKAHLRMRTKQIESTEYATYSGFYKYRDYMKIDLIDMHKEKKKIERSVTEFEQSLKEGTNMPVFRAEYERLKKKQHRLEKMKEELAGPNAFSLAKDLNTRLKLVDATMAKNKKRNSGKLRPLYKGNVLLAEEEKPDEPKEDAVSEQAPPQDDAKQNEEKVETDKEAETKEDKVEEKSPLPPLDEKRNVSVATLNANSNIPVTAMLASNPVYQRMLEKEREEKEAELKRLEEEEIERKRKEEAAKPPPPLRETLFADMHLNKPKKFVRRRSPLSGSLLKRKRHTEQRMNFYKEQSRLNVERKLSNSIVSLNKLANGGPVERHHKKSSRVSEHSETASTTTNSDDTSKVVRRRKREDGGLILPPIKVEASLLKELKEHRIRHKKESYGLPHLP